MDASEQRTAAPTQCAPAGPRRLLVVLSLVGILSPALLVAGIAVAGATRGRIGPVPILGLLTVVLAVGLHRGVCRSRWGAAGPVLLALGGVGLLALGGVRLMGALEAALSTIGPSLFWFPFAIPAGVLLVSRRMSLDPRWRGLAAPTLGAGIIGLIALLGLYAGSVLIWVLPAWTDGEMQFPGWIWLLLLPGLVLGWLACIVVLSVRLWRVARSPGRPG